jgi:hypothetical protein
MFRDKNSQLRSAGRPADYQKLGIDPVEVAPFEDGQRIGTKKGHYEWWYFDAHLDDGTTVVVVFYTKPNVSPNGPLAPRTTINLTLPDGQRFKKVLRHHRGSVHRVQAGVRREDRNQSLCR